MIDPVERTAFISAICADPNDVFPRLQYADWLEERGDVRGEFIRTQIELRRVENDYVFLDGIFDKNYCNDLLRRERELWEANARTWMHEDLGGLVDHNIYGNKLDFSRGFVERVEVSMQGWTEFGPMFVERAPIRQVVIVDRTPRFEGEYGWCWYLDSSEHAPPHFVPRWIWKLMGAGGFETRDYPTLEAAVADISRACLEWARDVVADIREITSSPQSTP